MSVLEDKLFRYGIIYYRGLKMPDGESEKKEKERLMSRPSPQPEKPNESDLIQTQLLAAILYFLIKRGV